MTSLFPGYEYDIFISYRQKDNKGDRWVSEFVDALRTELESTFKEEINLYFDINPHDGLLETHDVDASLKDKLKCLVFIPIISRTYCDPKSFAWEHEFKAFINQASQDQFGLKVKLPNGNVATRILPIQIHDLHPEDKSLLERELGGVLRSIEFIYKEPGVNKPLTADDDEKKNLNGTKYRIQINKVSNAIDEIIHSLKGKQTGHVAGGLLSEPLYRHIEKEEGIESSGSIITKKKKRWFIVLAAALVCIVVTFVLLKINTVRERIDDVAKLEKSIAVLPFVNDSPDQENTYFINGIMGEILANLQKIKDFRVLSRTSTEQYKGDAILTIPEIAKKLDINYIVEGSGQKYGNTFRLQVQLISAKNEKHLWGETYEQEIKSTKDIFRIQSEVAKAIAEELKANLTPDEIQMIEKTATTNLTAYDFYQRGEDEFNKFWYNMSNIQALNRAEELYKKALLYDSKFALAYAGLAGVYYGKHGNEYETYFTKNYLDSLLILSDSALSFDDHLAEGYFYRGWYFWNNGKTEQAIIEFDKALKYNPNDWQAYSFKGLGVYLMDMNYSDYVRGLEYLNKAAGINHGKSELRIILNWLGFAYAYYAGFPDEAKHYYQEAFKLDGDTITYLSTIGSLEIQYGDFENGIEKSIKAYAKDSAEWRLANQYLSQGLYKESLRYFNKYIARLKSLGQIPTGNMQLIGFLYWQNGDKEMAEYWFNEQKKLSLESIKLRRSYATTVHFSNNAYYDLANVYAFTGEKEKAYEILNSISHYPIITNTMVDDMKIYNPLFSSIRNEPEFQRILQVMEAKYQAEHERVRKWLEEQGKL